MKILKYFVICFFFTQQNKVLSQIVNFKHKLYVESNYNYGFVTPHHDFMAYFINDHVKGYLLNIGIYTCGDESWQHHYNYPRLGVGYYHSGLGNNNVYGKMDALYFYTDRLFLNINRKFNFGNKIYFGLGFINKRFDLYSNNFNLAISTKVNAFIRYDLEVTARISPLIQMKIGAGLTHTSNGNIREPNKGLNIISSFIDLQYSFSDQRQNIIHSTYYKPDTVRQQFLLIGAFGKKGISRLNTLSYPVYSLSGEYSYRITKTGWFGMALAGYMDRSIQKELETSNVDSINTPWDNLRLTLNLSYEMRMNKLAYVFQPGIYLKNSFKKSGLISNRIGLRYYFKNGCIAGIMIKAHWVAVADIIEWSFGYRLQK